jgi:hypothetical protein
LYQGKGFLFHSLKSDHSLFIILNNLTKFLMMKALHLYVYYMTFCNILHVNCINYNLSAFSSREIILTQSCKVAKKLFF